MTEKLEIEVETCGHLIVDVERKASLIRVISEDQDTFVTIPLGHENDVPHVGRLLSLQVYETICDLTKLPCTLHLVQGKGFPNKIDFTNIKRCPAFEKAYKKYGLEGINDGDSFFYAKKVKEAE